LDDRFLFENTNTHPTTKTTIKKMKKLLTVHSSTLYLILLSVVLLFTSEVILSKEYTVFTSRTPPTKKGFHNESFVVFNGHHDRLPKDEPFEKMKHLMDIPVAWASFDNEIQSNGWSTLQIKTNEKFDNEQQAFAAGYLEGFATAELIGPYWHAFKDYNYNNSLKSQFDDVGINIDIKCAVMMDINPFK
jgi:hypothetical protein